MYNERLYDISEICDGSAINQSIAYRKTRFNKRNIFLSLFRLPIQIIEKIAQAIKWSIITCCKACCKVTCWMFGFNKTRQRKRKTITTTEYLEDTGDTNTTEIRKQEVIEITEPARPRQKKGERDEIISSNEYTTNLKNSRKNVSDGRGEYII
jgi:hypothetical protein